MSRLGRTVLRLVVGGLCVAAAAAIVAILSGDFSDGDLKVIGTSLLFAVAASTGGAGETLRLRGGITAMLGTAVLAASAASFGLITYGMWAAVDSETLWRVAGILGIVTVDGAHACFVLARQRATDSPRARVATDTAVLAAAISGTLGILTVADLLAGPWQPLAVVLVVQLLATAMSPLLRRLARGVRQASADPLGELSSHGLAHELRSIADELERAASLGAVRDQAERLRHLAGRPDVP
jgi:hypothetical protein